MRPSQRSCVSAAAVVIAAVGVSCARGPTCPPILASATRLIVVLTDTMETASATFQSYERATPSDPWTPRGKLQSAVVGKAGLAWGHPFRDLARAAEPVKQEGDKRTPAGIFSLGATFGFEPDSHPNHLTLTQDQHVCVDEPSSPHYSRIVPRAIAGRATSGENMWAIPAYKRGVVVDYPASGTAKSGSCIFLHIWEAADQGTSGCVAAPEAKIVELQHLAREGAAAIAIVPKDASERFAACLPGAL
jgi:L,D-peptidoglycan transpeptidase YkuD (ErfK/YbiS/YcfS/YnhG family)